MQYKQNNHFDTVTSIRVDTGIIFANSNAFDLRTNNEIKNFVEKSNSSADNRNYHEIDLANSMQFYRN